MSRRQLFFFRWQKNPSYALIYIQIISYNIKTTAVLTDRAMATSIFHLEDGYINTNSYNNKYFKRLPLVLVFSIVN